MGETVDDHDRDDEVGDRAERVVDRFRQLREDDRKRRTHAEAGVVLDQFDAVEQRLLAFGRALGGDPDDVADLPFTEEAGRDGMPEPLYVRHDRTLLNQVTSWLLQRQHIGLVSEYGTGKTAFREILKRDLGDRDDFLVAHVDNPQQTTARGLYERVLRVAAEAGIEIDPDNYWQIRDGIPWATAETKQAVKEVAEQARAEDVTILLIIDEIEDLPEDLLSAIQIAGDAGVRLFLSGTPTGRDRLGDVKATLDSRLRYYEGIDPFEVEDIAEYIARSLSYFRGEDYDGESPDLFEPAAIVDIHDRTGGNPREVRLECRELFTRAAFVWYRSGQDVERIHITPELRHRRFGMNQ
ncbi:Orc1/cdc6 family replication initiation protein fused to HTH domain [Halorhabdus sp. SVX81]|uniref:ATP-binding protein n=1 Tax=Halorhabdus sp. SVX81 TaxID=2978283 RepID=UPI0023DABDE9|nr:ATP-binding protein [Halorhabdus sp. SVX81]WEL16535.1 Orc1/cdc6 family replication initiation protein fused to HTH domain [Halorhabdus sp. SVX81]